jgi:hypothetical protein
LRCKKSVIGFLKLRTRYKTASQTREIVGDFGWAAVRIVSNVNSLADAFLRIRYKPAAQAGEIVGDFGWVAVRIVSYVYSLADARGSELNSLADAWGSDFVGFLAIGRNSGTSKRALQVQVVVFTSPLVLVR